MPVKSTASKGRYSAKSEPARSNGDLSETRPPQPRAREEKSGTDELLQELQALRRSEANLRDFVETASIGLHWVSADGTVLWVNQAELDLLGYTREEYLGRH